MFDNNLGIKSLMNFDYMKRQQGDMINVNISDPTISVTQKQIDEQQKKDKRKGAKQNK